MTKIETTVEIDIEDYLDEVDTDALRAELEHRSVDFDETDRESLMEARRALLAGNCNEAICLLDKALFPKWSSPADCQAEYERVMGRAA